MKELGEFNKMVDDVIRELGVDPDKCRGGKEGQWNLRKGSAEVWIDIFSFEGQAAYFQAMTPISEVPAENKEQFYTDVLEATHQLFGASLTKFENYIYLKVTRELYNLDKEELKSIFNRTGYYADELDKTIRQKYFPNPAN